MSHSVVHYIHVAVKLAYWKDSIVWQRQSGGRHAASSLLENGVRREPSSIL